MEDDNEKEVILDSALVTDLMTEKAANNGKTIDWAHWVSLPTWTAEEATSLMMFYEPGTTPAHPDRRADLDKRIQLASRAQMAGNLPPNASPTAWAMWAVEQQWKLPRQLIKAMKAQEDVLHANVYKAEGARTASLHRGYEVPPENFTIHEYGSRREMLDAYAKKPDLAMSPESWATMLALEAAESSGIDDLDTQQRNKQEIMFNFRLEPRSLKLRTHLGRLWPKDEELPSDWCEGLYLQRDELRAWAAEHCPTLLGSPLLAAPPATAPQADTDDVCAVFKLMPKLRPDEISINFAAGESGTCILTVTARGTAKRMTLSDLELADRRGALGMKMPGAALLGFASQEVLPDNSNAMSKTIQRLNKSLKACLGLVSNPVRNNNVTGYESLMKVTDSRDAADKRAKSEAERRTSSLDKKQADGRQFASRGSDSSDPFEYEDDEAGQFITSRKPGAE